jgi:hypothetical protein
MHMSGQVKSSQQGWGEEWRGMMVVVGGWKKSTTRQRKEGSKEGA